MNNPDTTNETEVISKSQRKRDVTAMQVLGKKLTEISPGLFDKCQLPQHLIDAIVEFKRLPNKNEARRRQLQFIGKLMRKVDTSKIEQVLNQSKQHVELEKRKFHQLEIMREDLLAGNADTFNKLITEHPQLDIQHVRQLIRQSQKELSQNKPPGASRKLFKYLRQIVE
jgi:ribosome-associated protein